MSAPALALPAERPLADVARRVREHCLRMTQDGGCFVGASLSCADLLVHLYFRVLDVRPEAAQDPKRDYLLLSKGHDVPALYATLAERGFFPPSRLRNHLKTSDSLYWHPNRAIPGVEFHSGSLGHMLSVGIGIALDLRLREAANRVFVVLGDGELNEGSVWEAALVAAAQRLDNLVAIVDRNGLQANSRTEELLPLEPIAGKFEAFGWSCREADGHSFEDLERAFAGLPARPGVSANRQTAQTPEVFPTETPAETPGRPTAIVAHTLRGKGVASLEDRADRWFASFTEAEVDALIAELHGGPRARLACEGRVAR